MDHSDIGIDEIPGRAGPGATVEVEPRGVGAVRTTYAPEPDGDPDPGEIVWTWVPYEENDGRGKDRPVLVVAREDDAETLLAVQLSSRDRDHDREWMPLGTGPWDRSGRESWVHLDRVLRVHPDGMRREACALDRARFQQVVHNLQLRHGWR
ncbi:type II toxin-antitoxin system PemK/MazF family toxin [Streptomyces mayteni]